ncbi:MAG: hypothetical protein MI919_26765 [Holophagales bacterium]|nr:hypothetical protein [Holophagales bacterium]
MNGCLFSYLHCLEQEEVVEHFLTEMCVVPRFECGIACDLALQEGGPVDF